MSNDFWILGPWSMWEMAEAIGAKCYGFPRMHLPFLPHNVARHHKNFLATGLRGHGEKKFAAPHYLSEPFPSALALSWRPLDFFCHLIWRQREGSPTRAKRGKKATPRYVADPFAALCCIDKGFRGICATLSGGNPPRYETNHRPAHLSQVIGSFLVILQGRYQVFHRVAPTGGEPGQAHLDYPVKTWTR